MKTINTLEEVSQKVHEMVQPSKELLILPKQRYEPFFMKVMSDFMAHHNISEFPNPPNGTMLPYKLMSYILDVMTRSMGEEKRNELLRELKEYKEGLPFDLR